MNNEDLMIAYKVIGWAMNENKRASYNQSFMVVKNWLANYICDHLEENK